MRHTLVVLLLGLLAGLAASCGGDDADPHKVTTCSGWKDNLGNPIMGSCEAACASPPASTGEVCDTRKTLGCASFTFSGDDGCCLEDGGTIKFYECVP